MPTSRPWQSRIFPLWAETLDKGHGRLEQRRLLASTALNDYVDFPHVAQVCRIERAVTELKSGKQRNETLFAVTRLPPAQADPARLPSLNRAHWGVENRSHDVRDVTFREDHSCIRTGNGPAMMACLRNFAIALARLPCSLYPPDRWCGYPSAHGL